MRKQTRSLSLLFLLSACSAPNLADAGPSIGCLNGEKTENKPLLSKENIKELHFSSQCILKNKNRDNEIHIRACLPNLSPCQNSEGDNVKLILARPLHNVVKMAMKSIPKVELLQKKGGNINIYQSSINKDTRIYLSTIKPFYATCLETDHGACSVTGYVDDDIRYSLETKYDSSGRDWNAIHDLITNFVKSAQLP